MDKKKLETIEVNTFEDYNAEIHRITVESIQEALLKLMGKKEYYDITVKDIVTKAGVSRSAFYRNFKTKDDVVASIYKSSMDHVIAKMGDGDVEDAEYWINFIYEIFLEGKELGVLITSNVWHNDALLHYMNDYNKKMIAGFGSPVNEMWFRFWTGGFYNVYLGWIEGGMQEDPKELAKEIFTFFQ